VNLGHRGCSSSDSSPSGVSSLLFFEPEATGFVVGASAGAGFERGAGAGVTADIFFGFGTSDSSSSLVSTTAGVTITFLFFEGGFVVLEAGAALLDGTTEGEGAGAGACAGAGAVAVLSPLIGRHFVLTLAHATQATKGAEEVTTTCSKQDVPRLAHLLHPGFRIRPLDFTGARFGTLGFSGAGPISFPFPLFFFVGTGLFSLSFSSSIFFPFPLLGFTGSEPDISSSLPSASSSST
jgi:hypothetical protein